MANSQDNTLIALGVFLYSFIIMCTLTGIALIVSVLSWVKFILAVVLVGSGVFLQTNEAILRAFGFYMQDIGVGVLLLGLLSAFLVFPMRFGKM